MQAAMEAVSVKHMDTPLADDRYRRSRPILEGPIRQDHAADYRCVEEQ